MAEKDTRAPGAIKKAEQRAAKRAAETEARVAAVKARAGRATTDAAGALEQGTAEASARVQARKDATKKERTFGPLETRAREMSTRLLGGVPRMGPSTRGQLNPEDVYSDLPGKVFSVRSGSNRTRPMTGDELAGTLTLMAMRHELGNMMRRKFEPARGKDPNFVESTAPAMPVDPSKVSRHENLARERTSPTPISSKGRTRKFSKVEEKKVDLRELPQQQTVVSRPMDIAATLQESQRVASLREKAQSAVLGVRSGKKSVKSSTTEKRQLKRDKALSSLATPQEIRASQETALASQYGPETTPWQRTMSALTVTPRQQKGPIDTTPTSWNPSVPAASAVQQDDENTFVARFEKSRGMGVRTNVKDSSRYERIMRDRELKARLAGNS